MKLFMLLVMAALGHGMFAQTLGKYFPIYARAGATIYKVDINGNKTVLTTGGSLDSYPLGIALDGRDNVYAVMREGQVIKVDSAGNQSLFATVPSRQFYGQMAFDRAGNLFVATLGQPGGLYKIDPAGNVTRFDADGYGSGLGIAFNDAGALYVATGDGTGIRRMDGNGIGTNVTEPLLGFTLAFDGSGTMWVAQWGTGGYGGLAAVGTDGKTRGWYNGVDAYAVAVDYQGRVWASEGGGGTLRGRYVGPVTFTNDPVQGCYASWLGDYGGCTATMAPVASFDRTVTGMAFSHGYGVTGFAAPVGNAPTVNTVKAGRTVPVKWTLPKPDGTYQGDLTAVVSAGFQAVACGSFGTAGTSDLSAVQTAGGTGLRYDATANQYVYNWASPSTPGCYNFVVNLDSGQTLTAYFRLQ